MINSCSGPEAVPETAPCRRQTRTTGHLPRWALVRRGRIAQAAEARAVHAADQARRALEDQLLQSRKLEGLGALAGGLAHDLNNVLGVILALAAGARSQLGGADPASTALDNITGACERGRGAIAELLRFARGEGGSRAPVGLNDLAAEVAHWLSPGLHNGVSLVLDLEPGLAPVQAEPGALSQAILNLCVNAVDAMPAGGTLTLRSRSGPSGAASLSVRDSGAGMTPELIDRAREAFFTTKANGTGLGLPLVAATMHSLGGSLELHSQPGQGTEALLRFPGRPWAAPALPEAAPRPLRILMVDDDPHLRAALCPLLESLGHRVQEAAGGLEAIGLVETGLEVDVVLLDLDMPDLGGAQTLARLQQLRPGLAVLVASGHEGPELEPFLARFPSAGRIAKPFTLERLQARIAELDGR
jgi:signal transduction histidine kinase/CheY-like chemotaxis protein